MSQTVDAIYEDGVLKPAQPLNLAEGTRVALVISASKTAAPPEPLLTAEPLDRLLTEMATLPLGGLDSETSEWLDADLTEEVLPYDWGEQGIPQGKKVHYSPDQGFVVEGVSPHLANGVSL
ncbi:MAG: antitoxin family protein [Nodosilinea sp.]